MRQYRCVCDATVFVDNSRCLACGRDLGFCPRCRKLVALSPLRDGRWQCGDRACGAALAKCGNYSQHNVCNRCLPAASGGDSLLCDCCRFNEIIPDLKVEGNWEKWRSLELAKRRLLYDLDELGLPYGKDTNKTYSSLTFDFKADVVPTTILWRSISDAERVYTGHLAGRITINIREADDVERERLRAEFGEAHRTLIGHFRHEIGHYYWDQLVRGRREAECRAVFGDHERPTYSEAINLYYKNGPSAHWSDRYISAYATMHPWEDFAETWAAYLDIASCLETAQQVGSDGKAHPVDAPADAMIKRYQQLGSTLNEVNRSMGLVDVASEVFVEPVVRKLGFIHQLVQLGRTENGALVGQPPACTVELAAS